MSVRIPALPTALVCAVLFLTSAGPVPSASGAVFTPENLLNDCQGRTVVLYFARGSGEIATKKRGLGRTGRFLGVELARARGASTIGWAANDYPAVPVDRLDVANLVSGRYRDSVNQGVARGKADIATISRACPNAQLVLGGYSQGADVMRRILFELPADTVSRVAAVVLYADPWFGPERVRRAIGGRPDTRRVGVGRTAAQLRLTEMAPLIGKRYENKFLTWCWPTDFVCQSVGNFDRHDRYRVAGAARFVLSRLR